MKRIKHMWRWIVAIVGVIFMLLMISCNTNFDQIKNIPPAEFADRSIHRRDLAYHFSKQAGFNSVRIQIPTTVKILLVDDKYKPVDYYWFLKFNNWFRDLLLHNSVTPPGVTTENLDCDNFAMLYKSLMSIAAYKAGDMHEPAVALLTLRADHEFGGVPGNGSLHMNILVMTSQGWYVVEPQTGAFTLLEHYPNQHTVGVLMM